MTEKVYFLGIGGIGMSALARWFHENGREVAGYDRTPSALTQALAEEGMKIDHTGSEQALPHSLLKDMRSRCTKHWTIVWTPAIPKDFPLLTAFRNAGFNMVKRAEMLGQISKDRALLAVAGTHGKTTTSTILAHLLTTADVAVDAFLGGIAIGHARNLIVSEAHAGNRWMVAEADEFDRSFLHLHPRCAVITSVDPDHLDIYGDHAHMLDAFAAFAGQVEAGGLVLHADTLAHLEAHLPEKAASSHRTYGELPANRTLQEMGWDAGYGHVLGDDGESLFHLHLPDSPPLDITWKMPGTHNAANATAAALLALDAGVSPEKIAQGIRSFPGIARRFEIKYRSEKRVIVDDYAHHPNEIAGTIAAARQAFPGKRITGIFQPHLFTRTRDFLDEFAAALSALDCCVLLPIYPAREEPIPGVDAQRIGDKMTGCTVKCPEEKRFLDVLKEWDPSVLLFMGAGDLHRWIDPAWKRLEQDRTSHQIDTR